MEGILRSIWSEGRWKMFPQFTQLTFAGIEVACWDALGRALGVPTSTFFGGRRAGRDRLLRLPAGRRPGHARRARARARDEGYEVIYLKVGRGVERDDACVAAVREAIGPGRLLRIDPNEAWDSATAVDRIRLLERYDLDWVEQPTPRGRRQRPRARPPLGRRRRSRPTRRCSRRASSCTCSRSEAADVVVQGSHDAGGLLRWRQQAFLCEAFGLRMNRHAFMESELSFYANAQVASTIPNLTLGNQVMHQLLAERLTLGAAARRSPAAATGPATRPATASSSTTTRSAVAHERWQRDGAYNTIETLERRH